MDLMEGNAHCKLKVNINKLDNLKIWYSGLHCTLHLYKLALVSGYVRRPNTKSNDHIFIQMALAIIFEDLLAIYKYLTFKSASKLWLSYIALDIERNL